MLRPFGWILIVRTYRDAGSAHIVDTTENADQMRGFFATRCNFHGVVARYPEIRGYRPTPVAA
jgi:hypothetical protein